MTRVLVNHRLAALAMRLAGELGVGTHVLETLHLGALLHHERWDGTGYPDGLAGDAISVGARILSVADSIDAMSAPRVYRTPLTEPQIVRELEQGRGRQWDPAVVDVALEMIDSGELSFAADGLRIDFRAPVRPVHGAAVFEFPTPRNGAEREIAG